MRVRKQIDEGTILNPVYSDFDPLRVHGDPGRVMKLYRIRDFDSNHFREELANLSNKRQLFFSKVECLNDKFEVRPILPKVPRRLSGKELRSLFVYVGSAVIQSKEFGPATAPISHQLGFQNGVPRKYIEPFIRHYFQDSLFAAATRANKKALRDAISEIRASIRVCCLTENADSQRMWAYYGNHSGVCYELDDNFACSLRSPYLPYPISYKETPPEVSVYEICIALLVCRLLRHWTLTDFSFRSAKHPFFCAINKIVFSKMSDWCHEREVRLFDIGFKSGYREVPGLKLRRIICGADRKKEEVELKLKEWGIDVLVAQIEINYDARRFEIKE